MKEPGTILNLFLIILIILFSNSCKDKNKDCKKDGSCPPEYYRIKIGEEPKSYLWALPGSYWIYKNTVTGELDTQTCNGFRFDSVRVKGTFDYSKHITIEYDVMEPSIWSSFDKWNYYDRTMENSPDAEGFNNGVTKLDRENSASPGSITAFLHPFIIGYVSGNGFSLTSYIGVDSFMTIQGKTYFNVAMFNIDMDGIWYPNAQYPNAIYYWAKDVGLVKRENKTENFSWELIEYNIIK